jgi:hypothetical protein
MGLLDLLLGKQNQFSQFADTNSNTLGAIGAGLAQGPTFSQGMANAAQSVPAAKALDQQTAKNAATTNVTVAWLARKYPDLADFVKGGGNVSDAWSEALRRDAEASKQTVVGAGDTVLQNGKPIYTAPFKPNNPTNLRAGVGQPFFATNKTTNAVEPWQSMTDGTAINLANPKANPADYDFNPSITAFQRASGGAQGKVAGGVEAALPVAAQTAQSALDTIAKLRADTAGQEANFGTFGVGPIQIPDRYGPTYAQTPKANFQAVLQQAGGQAFLQAYSTLRGAGAISDAEGQKAGAAISRMTNPDISKDAFNSALDDYEAIIKAGYSRIQQQAAATGADPASMPQLSQPASSAAQSGEQTATNPQTGQKIALRNGQWVPL